MGIVVLCISDFRFLYLNKLCYFYVYINEYDGNGMKDYDVRIPRVGMVKVPSRMIDLTIIILFD